jgi:hypothetical protein
MPPANKPLGKLDNEQEHRDIYSRICMLSVLICRLGDRVLDLSPEERLLIKVTRATLGPDYEQMVIDAATKDLSEATPEGGGSAA